MSMANREQLDAAEETFPGPGPLKTDETKRGLRPVEQMVDAAIDRIAREQQAARDAGQRSAASEAGPGHAITRAPLDESASALITAGSARRARSRLRWKGLDVSDEFRSYAERVARGEDLPPFQGKILAEPDPAFPWDPTEQRRTQSRALKRQFGLWTGVALFLGACVWVLVVQVGNQSEAARRAAESPLATVVLANEPEAPKLDVGVAAPSAPQADDAEPGGAPAAQGTTALASLEERAASSVPVAGSTARLAALGTVGKAAPAGPVGVSVAKRSPGELPPATNATASVRMAPALDAAASANGHGTGTTGVVAAAGAEAAASSSAAGTPAAAHPVAAAAGTSPVAGSPVAGSPVAGSPVAGSPVAGSPVAGSPVAGNAPADPKKEPGREASTMAPLLVENPSF
jgi:hypothetical protein